MWWIWLALMVGVGVIIYLFLALGTKPAITHQLLRRKQVIARAEASNIASFFQTFGHSVALRAQLPSMERRDATTVRDMDAFVEQWKGSGLIGGMVFLDKQGIVRFNSNIAGVPDTGGFLGDRDYFAWASREPEEGGYFVGKPVISRLGVSKGRTIVVVASPVFQQGSFAGVVGSSVELEPLTKHYLELMKVMESTEVYLVDQNGNLLYSSLDPNAVGSNISEFLNTDNLKDILNSPREGNLQTPYPHPKTGKLEEHLIAYAPIELGSQRWLLVMSSPIEDANSILAPFYIRQVIMFLVVSLAILAFGVLTTWENQKTKKTE